MKFYIYDDSGSDYKMILDHNTTPFVAWLSHDDFIAAGVTDEDIANEDYSKASPITVNAQLASDTQGWAGNPRLITASEIAHITGMDTVNNGWEKGTNEFSFPLYMDDFYWLVDNLYDDGFESETPDNNSYEIPNHPGEVGNIWGYWTSDVSTVNYFNVWVVNGYGYFEDCVSVETDFDSGVRPVITLPKSSVTLVH